MKKDNELIQPKFSDFYIKLCMTEEIRSEFGAPIVKGNFCIHQNDPKNIYPVTGYPGSTVEIDVGNYYGKVPPHELTWLPTVPDILEHFFIQEEDGWWHGFENFDKGINLYGYSKIEYSQFSTDEEKWLIYCMMVKREKKFVGDEWVPFKYQ